MPLITNELSDGASPGESTQGKLKMKVSLAMLLKTNIEKMSAFRLATMLMKTNDLNSVCHDVDEKKGAYQNRQFPIPTHLRKLPENMRSTSRSICFRVSG